MHVVRIMFRLFGFWGCFGFVGTTWACWALYWRVAEGLADIYPRLGPTSEWDTAAGQCILEEAGGQLINLQGEPLMYNTKDSLLNPGFIGVGDSQFDWLKYLNTNYRSHT